MRRAYLLTLLVVSVAALAVTVPSISYASGATLQQKQKEPGRGDDLARIKRWRAFLDRGHRAFTAARMSTTAVLAKIEEADKRIADLEEALGDPDSFEGGRSDITGDIPFLERAHRAFTAARMSTTDVQRWLAEAREAAEGG